MKKNYLFALLFICFLTPTKAQTVLTAGDIAVVLINATDNIVNTVSNDDNISFVLLKAVTTNTAISFTDFGWRTDAQAFQTANPCGASTGAVTDGIVTWTATSNLPYGTVVHMNVRNNLSVNIGSITATQASYNSTIAPPLYYVSMSSAAGESVIAYQGSAASPTLITAIRMNSSWSTSVLNCDFSPSVCSQPSALTGVGNSFIWGQVIGNGRLKPSITLTGNQATDLAAIYNVSNWDFSASAYSTSTVLNVEDFVKNEVVIYPNPTTKLLQISGDINLKYSISNTLGQIIKTGTVENKIITIDELKAGMYIIELSDDKKSISKKFIKE
jgi:hypothetical protein